MWPTKCLVRWPTTVTSNTNSHIKNKFPTSKSNLPHQTQIRHSKSKIVTAKTIFATSKTKLSHQKQISPVFTRPSPDRHFVLAHGTVCGYVVLGPRIKNYNLEFLTSRAEIFPEDNFYGSRDHLKVAGSKRKYFSCNSKKGDLARGSLVLESYKQHKVQIISAR